MQVFFDETVLGDLLSDDGTPVAPGELAENAKLLAILDAAAGRIDSAATVARLYDPADLAALALTPSPASALLKELNCTLAMARLLKRRAGSRHQEEFEDAVKDAEEFLERLRKGERVFGLEANREAGLPTIDGPTAIDYQRLNLLPDRTLHYYPARANRLPLGRG